MLVYPCGSALISYGPSVSALGLDYAALIMAPFSQWFNLQNFLKRKPMTSNPTALRLLRRLRSLSLETVASATGIHKSTLSSLERGVAHPSRKLKVRLARFFGVEYDALVKPVNAPAIADAIVKKLSTAKETHV